MKDSKLYALLENIESNFQKLIKFSIKKALCVISLKFLTQHRKVFLIFGSMVKNMFFPKMCLKLVKSFFNNSK